MNFNDSKTQDVNRLTLLVPNSHYLFDVNTSSSQIPLTFEISTPTLARVHLSRSYDSSTDLHNKLTITIHY